MSTRQRDESGRFVKSGGQSLGTATATILMVADKFANGARVVQKASADAGKSVDGMAGALARAKKAASDFDNTSLGKFQKGLKGVLDQIALVSAAAAGITIFGVAQAREMARVNIQFTTLISNQKVAAQQMERLKKFAADFSLPESEILKAGAGLIPVMNATGASMDKLILSSSKLGQLDPMQGFSGAQTAIKEFLAGDVTSLYRRFELGISKSQYKKLLEDAHGDADAALDGLNNLISATGLTDEAFKKMNEADPFPVLTDSLKTALAEGFTPLLQALVPLAKDFAKWLKEIKENHPDLLKFAAGITAVVAAGAPLLVFISSAIAGFKAMKVAAAAVNMGGVVGKLGKVAGVGLAGAGGVALGTGIATGLANAGVRSGDLGRIADGESASDILGERIKQIIVIVADQLLNFAGTIGKVAVLIGNAVQQFLNVFRLGGSILGEMFGNLKKAIGELMVGIAVILAKVGVNTGGLATAGGDLQAQGLREAGDSRHEADRLRQELARGFMPRQEDIDAVDKGVQELKNTLLGGLIDALFPVEKAFVETAEDIAESVKKPLEDSQEYLGQQAQDIAAVQQKYNDEVIGAETAKQQAIIDLNKEFAAEQIQIAQERVKAEKAALEELNNDLRKLDTDLTREIEKEGRDRARKNKEMEIEFQRDELKDAQGHLEKLLKIKEDAAKKEQDFLENFDFASLFDLSEQVVEQTNAANTEYDKQRQERVQALQNERDDLVREFGAQREERLIGYEQDRADRLMAYEQERSQIVNEAAERLTLAQQAHANDLAALQSKFASEQALRQQAHANELAMIMQTEQQRLQIMAQVQEALLQQAYSFMNRARPPASGDSGSRNGSLSPSAVKAYNESIQRQRDRHTEAERAGKKTYGVGGKESGRAFGGPVLAGRTYPVNEPREGFGAEDYVRGTRTIPLPDGEGFFTPTQSGQIKPNKRGGDSPQVQVSISLAGPIDTGILTVAKAMALFEDAAEQGAQAALAQWMAQYAR